MPFRIQPRHLRRLAADQRDAMCLAPARQTFGQRPRDLRIELPERQIVKEENRLGPAYQYIIDRVMNQVLAQSGNISQAARQGAPSSPLHPSRPPAPARQQLHPMRKIHQTAQSLAPH